MLSRVDTKTTELHCTRMQSRPNGHRNHYIAYLKSIFRRRNKDFLVLWAGYSIDDASWAPANNFDYPEELQKMIARDNPIEDTSVL